MKLWILCIFQTDNNPRCSVTIQPTESTHQKHEIFLISCSRDEITNKTIVYRIESNWPQFTIRFLAIDQVAVRSFPWSTR